MIIIKEVNTVTGKKRYKVVSEPEPVDFNVNGLSKIGTELTSETGNTWRTRRGAERALKRWHKQNNWKET